MNTNEYFADVAGRWDQMRQGFFSEEVRAAAFKAARINSDAILTTAADIGAGTGFMTEGLVAVGIEVIAVYPVQEMLDILARKPYAVHGVECRLGGAEKIPIGDASVEFAFANMSLHHVEHPVVAIAEMCRILKPGGRLVITDMDSHTNEDLRRAHNDRWMGFERSQIMEWFRDAGLVSVEISGVGACCGGGASQLTVDGYGIGIFVASCSRP